MQHFDYEELLNILGKIHTEPAYSNIKIYIDSHRGDFTADQNQHIDEMIRMRDSYFNPPRCNQIKEIRSYYRDESGHEFSFAYTDGKAWALCEEAREQGIPLPKYISYIVGQTPGFIAWTIETSAGRPVNVRRATYEEQGYAPTRGIQRGMNRAISEENKEIEPVEVQITVADLINRLRADMQELIEESTKENISKIEQLRKEINATQSRIDALKDMERSVDEPKTISRVLDTSQYQYFLRNAYKLGLPVNYRQIARGEYQVTITMQNDTEEQKALAFIGDAEEHAREIKTAGKVHLEGFESVLDALCRNYEKASGMKCGLSRSGALTTLTDRLLEYASSQGVDWQAMYDMDSLDLFAKRGQIYTREQADEAFNNAISQINGRKIAERIEQDIEGQSCSPEEIVSYIMDFDAVTVIRHTYPDVSNPNIERIFNDAVRGLQGCGYYPNRLQAARDEAESEFRHYGTSYDDQVKAAVGNLLNRYGSMSA